MKEKEEQLRDEIEALVIYICGFYFLYFIDFI